MFKFADSSQFLNNLDHYWMIIENDKLNDKEVVEAIKVVVEAIVEAEEVVVQL